MSKQAIIVAGPTAVGKTAYAIELAKKFQTEILSADSRQCYRELDIGVAKPCPEELKVVPHHFINSHSITDEVNAAVYERYALAILEKIFEQHDVAIVVGGTGLYLRALTSGMDQMPEVPVGIRNAVEALFMESGVEGLRAAILEEDPLFAEDGDMQNPHRMMRALEILRLTGKSIRKFQVAASVKRPFDIKQIVLELPREELYTRINNRVDMMMEAGLLAEVQSLLPHRHLKALQTVGYTELFQYLDGVLSLEEAVDKIKQHTRNYAKRQITWFKRITH